MMFIAITNGKVVFGHTKIRKPANGCGDDNMAMDYCFECESHVDLDHDLHEECSMMAKRFSDIRKDINTGKLAEVLIGTCVVSVLIYCSLILITN